MNPKLPLPSRHLLAGTSIAKTQPWANGPVRLDSPASEVMTDLTLVKPASISPHASLVHAEQSMAGMGVHMLFVVTEMPVIEGLITSTDLLGERPVQLTRQRGVPFESLAVADVMTAFDRLEALDLETLQSARVSNVVATLKELGRNHLLVVDSSPGIGMRVRGVISRSQVERQLGEKIDEIEVAHCFADVVHMLN